MSDQEQSHRTPEKNLPTVLPVHVHLDDPSRLPPNLVQLEVHKEIIPEENEEVANNVEGFEKDHWKVIH